ncbi:MAG: hypothetical protein JW892_05565 [Anaerolineae bacterium]|nr:hypothetical protein [Anaerolineae bacterium]
MPHWANLIMVLLVLSPFILLWLITMIIIRAQHGWQAALRIGIFALPILIVMGAVMYGFILLPHPIRDGTQIAFYVLSISIALYYVLAYLLQLNQRGALWVDSKPQGFIDMGRSRFNALPLVFGTTFALIQAGQSGEDILKTGNNTGLAVLTLLSELSLALAFITMAFRRFQIRENGIVASSGRLIRWTSISSYEWIRFQDKVKLDLHPRFWRSRKPTIVIVPPELRGIVERHFEQQLGPSKMTSTPT